MRPALFLMTAMSCMVIAAGFYSRSNYVVGTLIGLVGIYYIARVFLGNKLAIFGAGREEPASERDSRPVPSDDDTAALRAELEQMLVDIRKRMIFTRSIFMLLAGGAAILFFFNWQLAAALIPFAGFFGYLFVRNAKAVDYLQRNL